MIRRNASNLFLGLALAVAITTLGAGNHLLAQQAPEANQEAILVGSYDPQTVFEHYPGYQSLMQRAQSAQSAIQEAQQGGDMEEAQQLQEQFQQMEQQTVQAFHQDMENALTQVAQETGVKAVGVQVVYTADDTVDRDVTDLLIEALGGERPESQPDAR